MARRKRQIITIDAETDPFEYMSIPRPFAWGVFDGETHDRFWGDEETIKYQLLERLNEFPKGTIVYAHNGGKFDFHFLLNELDEDMLIVNGRIAKCSLFEGKIELRDSYMLMPISLGNYDKIKIDIQVMRKDRREKHKDEILRYLDRDCSSLHELVTAFVDRFGLNMSLAGTAIKQLKKTGYDVPTTNDRYDAKFREFYHGGRVQVFKAGSFYAKDKPFKYADINSAYSTAMMKNHWYGTEHFSETKLPSLDKLGPCHVRLDAIAKSCLPFKDADGKLFFPDDNNVRTYSVTGWEILAGLETETLEIKKIHVCYRPLLTENFATYIQKWFDEKAASKGVDEIAYLFAKLMQNAAYGKFGQDGRKFAKFCIVPLGEIPELIKDDDGNNLPLSDPDQWKFHSDSEESNTSFFKRSDPSDRFYNVPVAASITGWVRAYLFRHIHASKGVMYCDTDSIICEEFVGKEGKELGDWEIEAELSEAHIAQRKMYACRVTPYSDIGPVNKTKIASKGVRLSYDDMKNGIENMQEIRYERDAPCFSLKGVRFIHRNIDLKNIKKSCINNPPSI